MDQPLEEPAGLLQPGNIPWTIYPAIDLRRGRVVRLRQGDPSWETRYADDPVAVAARWRDEGACWVHVVNLDGALEEAGAENLRALERILETGLAVQFGGGLRELEAVSRVLEMGVRRAVLGTAAVQNPALIREALDRFGPERIALALDLRGETVCVRGWREALPISADALAREWAEMGVCWLIVTDVSRDGTGEGLNVETAARLARLGGLRVIASGGVAGPEDIRRARRAGLHGVIIGRALYEGHLSLRALLAE